MKQIKEIFDDRYTKAAGLVFLLILGLVIFNIYSTLPLDFPLFGVFNFSMVPVLFLLGGVIMVLAILQSQRATVAEPDLNVHISRRRNKLLFLMFTGAFSIILLLMGGYKFLEFSDSTNFCGRLCHEVMYPEYTAYQDSPHSRVGCALCHVGYGGGYMVRSKISGIPQVIAVLTNSYERPISTPVKNLRPARETCEQCHRPERFAGDLVLTHTTYDDDEANTAHVDQRTMRVGGGEEGLARDIHWHIAANVWYIATDEGRQNITWVGVEDEQGKLKEWADPAKAAEVTPALIEKEKRLMDCMDCHNRATHVYSKPQDLIDTALTQGKIDNTLPYIKWLGVNALDPVSPSLEQAYAKVEIIKEFYRINYASVTAQKSAEIDTAIDELKTIAKLTTFPDMKITWNTYVDNAGHQDWPGCLRCHGKLETTGQPENSVVDSNCNLCHYLQGNK